MPASGLGRGGWAGRLGGRLWLLPACGGLALLTWGCRPPPAARLDYRQTRVWTVPPDGYRVPAPRSAAAAPDGRVFVLDTAGRVLVYRADGTVQQQWMMPDTEVGKPEGVCVLRDGRIAICDTHYHRLVFFDADGRLLETRGTHGRGPGQFIYPVAITQDEGGALYVAEYGGNDRVQKFTADGQWVLSFGAFGTGPGQLQRPSGLLWRAGRLYVADAINNRVLIFRDDGQLIGPLPVTPSPLLRLPYDIAGGPDETLLVIAYGTGQLLAYNVDGALVGSYAGTDDSRLRTPWGLTVTASGQVIIADAGNRRLVELRP